MRRLVLHWGATPSDALAEGDPAGTKMLDSDNPQARPAQTKIAFLDWRLSVIEQAISKDLTTEEIVASAQP